MILHHLTHPRTIADLRRLTGLPDPEIREHLRRLGPRVRTVKPADPINDRAIRYQRNDDAPAVRDLARPPQRAEGNDPDRSADPQTLPVDLPGHNARGNASAAGDDGGRQDGRAADAGDSAGREREGCVCRPLGAFEVDRETIPLGLAICRALEGGAYLSVSQIAEVVTEMRGPTAPEAIQGEITRLHERRLVKRAPSKWRDKRTGRSSRRWALAMRGETWKGGTKSETRKRAILATLANGPATIPMLADIVAGLHRTRAVAILAELANDGKVVRAGYDHIRDAAGRRRRVIVWALGPR